MGQSHLLLVVVQLPVVFDDNLVQVRLLQE
jgi:hypothetical protein